MDGWMDGFMDGRDDRVRVREAGGGRFRRSLRRFVSLHFALVRFAKITMRRDGKRALRRGSCVKRVEGDEKHLLKYSRHYLTGV